MEYYSVIYNKWKIAICSNMDGLRIMGSEISKRKTPYDFIFMWNLEKETPQAHR